MCNVGPDVSMGLNTLFSITERRKVREMTYFAGVVGEFLLENERSRCEQRLGACVFDHHDPVGGIGRLEFIESFYKAGLQTVQGWG